MVKHKRQGARGPKVNDWSPQLAWMLSANLMCTDSLRWGRRENRNRSAQADHDPAIKLQCNAKNNKIVVTIYLQTYKQRK